VFSVFRMSPDKAYRANSLFLPKEAVLVDVLEAALTFGADKEGDDRILLKRHVHHVQVPREFLSEEDLREMGIQLVDLTPKTFAPIDFKARDGFQLRDRQKKPWAALSESDNGVLSIPPGCGKTVLGLLKVVQVGGQAMIVSPQAAHLDSWEREINRHFVLNGRIGWVRGQKTEWDADIVFCTVQTLWQRALAGAFPPEFYSRFALVIYDEVHLVAGEKFAESLDVGAGRRIGLTATVNRMDQCEGVFLAHLGKILYFDREQEMEPYIHVWPLDTVLDKEQEKECEDVQGNHHFGLMRKVLATHEGRNATIIKHVKKRLDEGRVVYALTHNPEHAEFLADQFPGAAAITGNTPSGDRVDLLETHNPIFLTFGVGAANYNRADIDCLLLLTPFSAKWFAAPTLEQALGRAQRRLPGKPQPLIDIFVDVGIGECVGLITTLLKYIRRTLEFPIRNHTEKRL